jgi:hypothetical protein
VNLEIMTHKPELLVMYASQKGTAKDIAELIQEKALPHGWKAQVACVDQFSTVCSAGFHEIRNAA